MRLEFDKLEPIFFLDLCLIISFVLTLTYLLMRLLDFRQERHIINDVLSLASAFVCVWEVRKKTPLNKMPLKCCSDALLNAMSPHHIENDYLPLENLINLADPRMRQEFETDIFNLIKHGKAFSKDILIYSSHLIHFQGASHGHLRTLYGHDITNDKLVEQSRVEELNSLKYQVKQYKEMIDKLPIAVWKRDKEGKIDFCNIAFAGALESSQEEVMNEGKELISKSKRGNPYHLSLKAIATGERQIERCHTVIQGVRRWLEVGEIPLQSRSGTIGYCLDLTELENLEKDLERHTKAHKDILQHLSTPIAVFSGDKKISFFNQAYLKLFSLEESWLYTKPSLTEIIDELRKYRMLPEVPNFLEFKKDRLRLFQTLLQPMIETLHLPNGRILRMMIAPYPMGGLIYIYDDLTDRIALEQRHQTLIAVQKETIDHLYEGIAVFGNDFRLRLYNPALLKLWVVPENAKIINLHLFEILENLREFFPQDELPLEKVKDILTNLFEERSPKDDHFMRTDQMVLKYSYVPLPDGSHLISFVDISDSWRFEKALRERNEALEQSENLRTEFLSHVAYELRSPVNSVIGFSEILLNQYFGSLNERQEEYCQSIFKSSQRLMLLINDAVDLMALETKQFALSRASIDLDQFIQSTLSLLHNRAYDQGIDIHVDIRTKTKQFTADDRRLKQALFHLLTNSLRYTPTGGAIKLTVDTFNKNVKQASQIFIMFRIDDTGIGVTKEKMKEIKLLLKSKKNTQKQAISGLGLPLVKRLIEMHGGTFTLDSSENKGCTAICSIPLLKESPSMYEKRMPKTDTQQSINDVISS